MIGKHQAVQICSLIATLRKKLINSNALNSCLVTVVAQCVTYRRSSYDPLPSCRPDAVQQSPQLPACHGTCTYCNSLDGTTLFSKINSNKLWLNILNKMTQIFAIQNKKFELMLMRRAKAYSSSSSVY